MNHSMIARYIGKKYEEISKQSVEYKAYQLGYAAGYYNLYEYIKQTEGQVYADKLIDSISKDEELYEILKELIMLSDRKNQTKAEKILEALHEYKQNKRDESGLVMDIMKVFDKYNDNK